jgi:hypothetical protein
MITKPYQNFHDVLNARLRKPLTVIREFEIETAAGALRRFLEPAETA